MHALLESKRAERRRLTALPFSEKVALLERLRDRALAIAGSGLYRDQAAPSRKALILRETRGRDAGADSDK